MHLAADGLPATRTFATASPKPAEGYKPHIDGLRAISIAAVLGFHAEVSGFGGGFVGVDIFFVISGYLIINQIVAGIEAGRFSIWDFYARRALRILPPYGIVLLATILVGSIVIRSPRDLENFSVSAAVAPLFLTNFYYLMKSGYFDVGAHEKPLLHTWSLSVEEQFYLVAPLLLIGLFYLARRRGWRGSSLLAVAAAGLGVASLLGCIHFTPPDNHPIVADRNPAFFLTQWRAWQFVAGGVIGFLVATDFRGRERLVANLAGTAGILLLGVSIGLVGLEWLGVRVGLFGRVSEYPGVAAILPTLGAVLVIGAGILAPASPVARVLSLAPLVFVGRISYALYLWHWPLLVFGRMLPLDASRPVIDATALALSVVLAIATHFVVERPIASWRQRPRLRTDRRFAFRVVAAAFVGCFLVAGTAGIVAGSAYFRSLGNPMLAEANAAKVHGSGSCLSPVGPAAERCLDGEAPLGILVGDSHAYALLPRIEYEAERNGSRLFSFTTPGCSPLLLVGNRDYGRSTSFCEPMMTKLDDQIPKLGAETEFAILNNLWNSTIENGGAKDPLAVEHFREMFGELLRTFDGGGQRRLLVVGPIPELYVPDPFNCVDLGLALGLSLDRCGIARSAVELRRKRTVAAMREVVSTFPNARFVDPIDLFCDERICSPLKADAIAYMDNSHLNDYGAKLLYETFEDDFLWAFKG